MPAAAWTSGSMTKPASLAMTGLEHLFDRIEAGHVAGGVGQGERAAVTIGRVGVEGGKQK